MHHAKYGAKDVLEIVLDRIQHYIKGWEKIGTSDRQLTMPIVMQQSELLKFAKWEKGKNLTETFEWEGAAGILQEYLRAQEITIE